MKMRLLRAALSFALLMIISSTASAQVSSTPTTYYLATTYTNTTTSPTNITGLAFAVNPNGSYHAVCHIIWNASTSTAGPKYMWQGPNANTLTMFTTLNGAVTLTTFATQTVPTYATTFGSTTANTPATNFTDTIEMVLINGNNTGTVQLQAAPNGAGTLTIQTGSNCIVQ